MGCVSLAACPALAKDSTYVLFCRCWLHLVHPGGDSDPVISEFPEMAMPLTMTCSIQLELAIDAGLRSRSAALAPGPGGQSYGAGLPQIDSRRGSCDVRKGHRARSVPCRVCGGPLVLGEGARTCVICGKSSRRAS